MKVSISEVLSRRNDIESVRNLLACAVKAGRLTPENGSFIEEAYLAELEKFFNRILAMPVVITIGGLPDAES